MGSQFEFCHRWSREMRGWDKAKEVLFVLFLVKRNVAVWFLCQDLNVSISQMFSLAWCPSHSACSP